MLSKIVLGAVASLLTASELQVSAAAIMTTISHYNAIHLPHHSAQKDEKRSPQEPNPPPPYMQPNAFLCDGVNFQGDCLLVPGSETTCWSLAHDPSWNKRIAAFGPDQGLLCTIYTSTLCGDDANATDKQMDLEYPGIADLNSVGFADQIQSWTCAPCEGCGKNA